MNEHCDILIVGAGAAGSYFGWQMARKGYSVVIVERSERSQVGTRLDVFHIDSVKFDEFGVPPPDPESPEFCVILEEGTSYSPEGKYPKTVRYPFHVMRLPLFLQRMFTLAESEGVIFSEQDLTDMNRDLEMHLTTAKILRIFSVIALGLLTGSYSFASLKALLSSVRVSGRIRAHYESFPESRSDFPAWVASAEDLWSEANPRMS